MEINDSAVATTAENKFDNQPTNFAQPFTTVSTSKVTLVQAVEINATAQTIWKNLCELANLPEWFGTLEISTPLEYGPHEQVISPFSNLFTALNPFRSSDRLAQLHKLEPNHSVAWQAQGHQMTATQTWYITNLSQEPSADNNFQPNTLVTVEINFSGMSEWYFNVMEVRSKMLTSCNEILLELRRYSE
jgi:hypothetical protein